MVDAGVCITQESDSKLVAIIKAAHAFLAAGDAEAARDLLASLTRAQRYEIVLKILDNELGGCC